MVWCCMVQYVAMRYGMVWYSALRYGMLLYGITWYDAVLYGTVVSGPIWTDLTEIFFLICFPKKCLYGLLVTSRAPLDVQKTLCTLCALTVHAVVLPSTL